jgi:hypothetical protein
LAEAEKTAGNLFTALIRMSLKAGEAIERALILVRQLEKVSLFLVMAREEKAIMALRNECTICRLTTLRV